MTVGAQRALGASWLQTAEAREQAVHELRHLGLPAALADDLLASAAYRLARDLDQRQHPLTADDQLAPAWRALGAAARAMLRARRTASVEPLRPSAPGGDRDAAILGATPLDETRLQADPEVTDRRRRMVSALAVDRPHERAAALTALTLATEPRIEPDVVTAPADDPGPVGRLVWAGLAYAGRTEIAVAGPEATAGGRRAELALRQRQTEAIGAVEQLLVETLAVEERASGDGSTPAPDTPVGSGSSVTPEVSPATGPTNDLVHRRAAHG